MLGPGAPVNEERARNMQAFNNSFGNRVTTENLIPTRDGLELDVVWSKNTNDPQAGTVIIYHGNGMTSDDMTNEWGYYKSRGMNVLLVNVRKYAKSSPAETTELGFYYDAEAALKFVLSQDIAKDKIIVHGFSMGGIPATATAYFFPTHIKALVLDHTLTSVKEVFQNVTQFKGPLLPAVVIGAARGAFPEGKKAEDNPEWEPIPDAKEFVTDNCSNLAKVGNLNMEIFIIQGDSDEIMNQEFGNEFYRARYPEIEDAEHKRKHLITIEDGTHNEGKFHEFQYCKELMRIFLEDNQIIDKW